MNNIENRWFSGHGAALELRAAEAEAAILEAVGQRRGIMLGA